MEVQNYLPEPLNFETKSSINIEKQRKILQYYSKPENERPKKNKAQLFTMQNIMGLASVLDINTNKLQLICQQVLSTEFNIFMQTAKRFNLSVKQPLQIVQGTLIVLLDGCIIKKLENICNLSSLLLNNMMLTTPTTERGPSRNRSILIPGQNRKNITKSIETNPKQSPKLISHESSQPRPYECKTNVCYLQFSDLTLQKLQNWIQIKEKESLTNFISSFFPQIDDRKALSKLANKARRVLMYHKNQFSVQPNVAYLIFKGTILLKSDCYQIQLNNKSIIFKSQSSELKTTCISSTVIIISILLDQISQILEDSKQIMKAINYKLKNIHEERKKLFEKTNFVGDACELMEPVFPKEILNMRAFQRGSNKQNIIELKKISKNKINKPKGFTATPLSSKRSKLGQQFSSSITLPSEMSIFLSNYPFIKIVQSEERARSIIKMSLGLKGLNKKQKPSQQQVSEEQKRKVEKQIKRLYYNDKVMRLKIRNIAQKQIPNGKKKNFDSGKAQKQISEYLLFKNIIEYPMDGQSENATKQALNQKIIAKFTKMSSLNFKSDNKTSDNAYLRSKYDGQMQDYKCEDDSMSMISVNGSALDSNTTPKMEDKVTNIGSNNVSGMYDKNDSYSSYCNRVLYPHLKIHKSGKLKSPRMSNNKMQKQNNDFVKIIKLQQGQTVRNSSQMQNRRQNIFLNKLKKVCLTNGHRMNTVS